MKSFSYYENLSAEITGTLEYKNQLVRVDDPVLQKIPSELYRTFQYNRIVDTFTSTLDHRITGYEQAGLRFGFWANFDELSIHIRDFRKF